MKNIIMLIVFCTCSLSFSQEKNEIERRIKKKEVPETAKKWLKGAYENKRKTKWYYQTDGKKHVYEAKLKYKKHLHSVEFDTLGTVQNIEILIQENELDKDIKEAVHKYLNTNYNKFSISKIQIQYSGDEDDLEDIIDENEFKNITINYEIEYYGRSDHEDELWEGLFDEKGRLIKKRIINLKATDNLDY